MFACVFVALLAGCGKTNTNATSTTSTDVSHLASGGVALTGASVTGDRTHGALVFSSNCASCHGATGVEGGVGPSLKDEKKRKDMGAAVAWIKNPQPPMPKLYPDPLSQKDVADVAAYVESL